MVAPIVAKIGKEVAKKAVKDAVKSVMKKAAKTDSPKAEEERCCSKTDNMMGKIAASVAPKAAQTLEKDLKSTGPKGP